MGWNVCFSALLIPPYLLPYSANKIADPAPARDLEGFIFARFYHAILSSLNHILYFCIMYELWGTNLNP